jgi:hypothetical protein
MKLSWILVLILMVLVALFSVQNAGSIHLRFIVWDIDISAALAVLTAALCGGVVGLLVGSRARPVAKTPPTPPTAVPMNLDHQTSRERPHDVFPHSTEPSLIQEGGSR